jgi:hypothetical protein
MSDLSQPVCSLASCGQPAVLVWLKWSDPTNTNLINVFACINHQLNANLAAEVHQSTCTAPNPANLPNCDCTASLVSQPEAKRVA